MIKLHRTRLMRAGEVALWYRGKLVWQGNVGADVRGVTFDALAMNVHDGERLTGLLGERTLTAEVALATLADWWA